MTEKIAARMDNIDHKLNELQKDMEEIWILLGEMKSDLRKNRGKSDSKNHIKRKKRSRRQMIKIDGKGKYIDKQRCWLM